MPPSKQLGGSEALTCLYVNLPFFRNKSVQETFVGYDIKRDNRLFVRLDFIITTSMEARRDLFAILS